MSSIAEERVNKLEVNRNLLYKLNQREKRLEKTNKASENYGIMTTGLTYRLSQNKKKKNTVLRKYVK